MIRNLFLLKKQFYRMNLKRQQNARLANEDIKSMDEEKTSDIQTQEVVSPESVQPETQEVVEQKPEESSQEKNWRELRTALKELKRENQHLRQQFEQTKQPNKPHEEEEENEPYITPKTFKRKLHELETKLKEKEVEGVSDRLRAKYSDFDEVVSVDNVEYLNTHEPELALSLAALKSDPYKQGIAAYKILKNSELSQNKVNMQDKAKIQENAKKPTSVQAVRKQGALADANRFSNGLTPELKKSLWAEMQNARKGA
jgi:hypothetical protein